MGRIGGDGCGVWGCGLRAGLVRVGCGAAWGAEARWAESRRALARLCGRVVLGRWRDGGDCGCRVAWGAGRFPACQSRKICSRRAKRRARMARMRVWMGLDGIPLCAVGRVMARRPASWSAILGGVSMGIYITNCCLDGKGYFGDS